MWKALRFLMNTVIGVVAFFVYGVMAVCLFLFAGTAMIVIPSLPVFVLSGGSLPITYTFAVVVTLFWGLLIFCEDKLKISL